MSNITFADFVSVFPQVTMPATLGEDTHHVFSTENEPLSLLMIEQFIYPAEGIATDTEDDEMTEYVPCFSIEGTDNFVAVVWWKAALLHYDYHLATYNMKGELIDHKVIAYTKIEGEKITSAVAIINEEWEIAISEGTTTGAIGSFDPTSSKTRFLELMATGEIV